MKTVVPQICYMREALLFSHEVQLSMLSHSIVDVFTLPFDRQSALY